MRIGVVGHQQGQWFLVIQSLTEGIDVEIVKSFEVCRDRELVSPTNSNWK
jgi:hypothetical protein